MITLGQAIKFDHTKKAKSLTGGVFIPIVSNYRAKKALKAIQDIFKTEAELESKIELHAQNDNLVLRQIIYSGLYTVLKEGRNKELEEGKKLFKEFFFIEYDKEKHLIYILDQIKKLDERIVLEPKGNSTTSFAQVVEWVEVVRDKGSIDRSIALYDFKEKYETAIIIAKRQDNGRSN